MKRRRFFVVPENISGTGARLSAEESHHLRDVLRLRIGDPAELFDGLGVLYQAVVRKLAPQVELEILSRSESRAESPLRLVLGQSLVKGQKLDWIIQKCTELGMAEMVPLESHFSEISIEKQSIHQRQERWRRIAVTAAKQCRRAVTPLIHPAVHLVDFCARLKDGTAAGTQGFLPHMDTFAAPDLRLVISEKGGVPAGALSGFTAPTRVLVLVGPEGGWSDEESVMFRDSGFQQVSLGTRILRTETAAVAISTILQFLWGDLAGC